MESEAVFFFEAHVYQWMCSAAFFSDISRTAGWLLNEALGFLVESSSSPCFFARNLCFAMTRWSFVHDVTRPSIGSSLCTESANCKSCFPPFDTRTCNYDEFIILCPTRNANFLLPRKNRETKVAWNNTRSNLGYTLKAIFHEVFVISLHWIGNAVWQGLSKANYRTDSVFIPSMT